MGKCSKILDFLVVHNELITYTLFPAVVSFAIGMAIGGIIRQKEIESLRLQNETLQSISEMYMEHLRLETTSVPLYRDENETYGNR